MTSNYSDNNVGKYETNRLMPDRRTADNTGLAKVAVQCSADTFVVNQSLVLRINICGENRHLRQAREPLNKPSSHCAKGSVVHY